MSTDGQMDKEKVMCALYIYIYIYMNVTQSLKNQIMSFAAIWIDLEIVSFLWDYQRKRGKQQNGKH